MAALDAQLRHVSHVGIGSARQAVHVDRKRRTKGLLARTCKRAKGSARARRRPPQTHAASGWGMVGPP
eukprot:scaffold766_cov343-Pavlova_lutheri.AAC.20